MSLSALQDAVVALVDERFPKLRTCRSHPGRFTREEIREISLAAPGVLVALPTVRGVEAAGGNLVRVEAKTVAVIVCKDAMVDGVRVERADAALGIAGELVRILPDATLGEGVEECRAIQADNLYGTADSKQGLALWAVHWTNTVTLRPAEVELGEALDVRGSLTPRTGLEHIDDYKSLPAEDLIS